MKNVKSIDKTLPLVIGLTDDDERVIWDFKDTPNILISGVSDVACGYVCCGLISSLIAAREPKDIKIVALDIYSVPFISELCAGIMERYFIKFPYTKTGYITHAADALKALLSVEEEMRLRYDLLMEAEAQDITEYNRKFDHGELNGLDGRHRHLPTLVIVIYDYADGISYHGDDFLLTMIRIAQLGSGVDVHIVASTCRISTDVINGLIKANFKARIACKVKTSADSKLVIDGQGAENLNKDEIMVYHRGNIIRLHRYNPSPKDMEAICDKDNLKNAEPYDLPAPRAALLPATEKRDPLFAEAAAFLLKGGEATTSALQHRLGIGYHRSAIIMDQLEYCGIVGPVKQACQPRDVLIKV